MGDTGYGMRDGGWGEERWFVVCLRRFVVCGLWLIVHVHVYVPVPVRVPVHESRSIVYGNVYRFAGYGYRAGMNWDWTLAGVAAPGYRRPAGL